MISNAPSCKIQWFLLILLTLWLTGAMTLPFIAFCLTHNLLSFSFFATLLPPVYILRRIIWYAFPKDDRDYKLAEVKAMYANTKQHNKKQGSNLQVGYD